VQIDIAKDRGYDADQVDSKGKKVKPEGLLPRKTPIFKHRRACFHFLEAYHTTQHTAIKQADSRKRRGNVKAIKKAFGESLPTNIPFH
jgi:hypothetical protein